MNFSIWHFDTFHNTKSMVAESNCLSTSEKIVKFIFKDVLWPDGCDIVEIVSKDGKVQNRYRIK